jgi:hypothetical protein
MADIADLMDSLVQMAFSACYPSGPNTTSVTGKLIHVGEGWPLVEDIDGAMVNGQSLVPVYAIPGSTQNVPQIFDWSGNVYRAPVHGLTATVDGIDATLSGTANAGEYATLTVNGSFAYSYAAPEPQTGEQIAAALLALVQPDFPDATCSGATLTIDGAYQVILRIGAKGQMGRMIHRQIIQFQIVTWAPTPADRTTIGRAVDVAIKTPVRLTMPDGTTAIISPRDTRLTDREQNKGLYRRDLVVGVQFDTLEIFDAYEVTSVQTQTTAPATQVTTKQ